MGKAIRSDKSVMGAGASGVDGAAVGARPTQMSELKPGSAGGGAGGGAAGVGMGAARAQATHEEIARRAYEVYLERCQRGLPGTPDSDWTRAEAELRQG
jgi:hypothetical protein